MCTTGICNAIYVLVICFTGWLATAVLITIRGTKVEANQDLFKPLVTWTRSEIFNPIIVFLGFIRHA